MTEEQTKLNDISKSSGASSWLSNLPLKDENFNLTKREFFDATYLRYGWDLKNMPVKCVCSEQNTISHALNCKLGGFITIRHNELRDVTANALKTACKDVAVKPDLELLTGETLPLSTRRTNEARADISMRGFWQRQQKTFLDVRVFNHLDP